MIEHTVRAIRSALQDRQEPNVLVRFFDNPQAQRIIDATSQHGAVKVKTLNDGKWKFLDDRDYIYSMR